MKTLVALTIWSLLWVAVLTGCASSNTHRPSNLVEEQQKILDRTQEYVECLKKTKEVKGSFDAFDLAIKKCIADTKETP